MLLNGENGADINTYINNMSKESTMGGGIEIKCFCDMYNMSVIVHYENKEIKFIPNNDISKTVELNYTGSHYTHIPCNSE